MGYPCIHSTKFGCNFIPVLLPKSSGSLLFDSFVPDFISFVTPFQSLDVGVGRSWNKFDSPCCLLLIDLLSEQSGVGKNIIWFANPALLDFPALFLNLIVPFFVTNRFSDFFLLIIPSELVGVSNNPNSVSSVWGIDGTGNRRPLVLEWTESVFGWSLRSRRCCWWR